MKMNLNEQVSRIKEMMRLSELDSKEIDIIRGKPETNYNRAAKQFSQDFKKDFPDPGIEYKDPWEKDQPKPSGNEFVRKETNKVKNLKRNNFREKPTAYDTKSEFLNDKKIEAGEKFNMYDFFKKNIEKILSNLKPGFIDNDFHYSVFNNSYLKYRGYYDAYIIKGMNNPSKFWATHNNVYVTENPDSVEKFKDVEDIDIVDIDSVKLFFIKRTY